MGYTAGQAAFDLAVLAGWTLLGLAGAVYYWSTNGSETYHGCASSGALCE